MQKTLLFQKKQICLLIFFFFTLSLFSQSDEKKFIQKKADEYIEKYNTNSLYYKITDNFGDSFPSLYGTRNMRVVLNGILYRGGANNFYNKNNKRDNKNPLPEEGLNNLSNEGFSTAIYLYSKNFDNSKTAYPSNKNNKTLSYLNNTLSNEKELKKYLELVYRTIMDSSAGPIYVHCWNGWHQSGYASTLALMQFCGFSNKEAYNYWEKCAYGNLSKYSHIKKAILKFKPYKEFLINDEIKSIICPCK